MTRESSAVRLGVRVKPYAGLLRMRMRAMLAYRWAAAAGVATQWLFGLARVMVLMAFYHYNAGATDMPLSQAITYTWLGQAVLGILPWNGDPEINESVRSGQVAYELCRPVDLYWMWYARSLAMRSATTLLRAGPQFVIALLIVPPDIRMVMPDMLSLLCWIPATLAAVLLAAAVTNLLHIALFWTVNGEGLVRLLPNLLLVLTGMMVPLPLLPDGLQTMLRLQPFAGIMDLPIRLFCGELPPGALPEVLALQLFWTAVMLLLGRYLIGRGLKRLEVAGG